MLKLSHPYVGSEHFLLAILSAKDNDVSNKLLCYGIDYNSFRNRLLELIGKGTEENDWFLFTPLLKRVIENAILDGKDKKFKSITSTDLFMSLLDEGEGIGVRILMSLGFNADDFYNDLISYEKGIKKVKNKHSFLEEFGVDLVEQAKNGELDPVIGREKEINQVIETLLRRKKNNPLLIGPAGVGKTAIVEGLARLTSEGNVPDALKKKRIVSISMASIISGTKYRGEFEERMSKLIREVEKNEEYIIFIDEIHTIMGAGGAEGAIDASNILKPALSRGAFPLIGATTEKEYKQYIFKDKALERRFQTVLVKEPDVDKTINILRKIKPIYESYYNLAIPDFVLEQIVLLTNQYVHKNRQPDKSIEVLDSAACHASLTKSKSDINILQLKTKIDDYNQLKKNSISNNNFIEARRLLEKENDLSNRLEVILDKKQCTKKKRLSVSDVKKVIEEKANIIISFYDTNKKSVYKMFKNRIFGQDEVLKELTFEITKHQLKKVYDKPLSFLFVGPSGVGKTYTAEVYNNILNNHNQLLRLDMSEYGEAHSISKILGAPAGYIGYSDGYSVLKTIQEHPNTVLLLDEIEKAHSSVINLFLQILDYGRIKDSSGEEICFSHTTIIMTSNLKVNGSIIGFNSNEDKIQSRFKDSLGMEFVNRINKILVFEPLTKDAILKIIDNKWAIEKSKYNFIESIEKLSKDKRHKILCESNYKECGARQLDGLIENEMMDLVFSNKKLNISV